MGFSGKILEMLGAANPQKRNWTVSIVDLLNCLHKTVLHKVADNGGNVPKELLD